MARDRKQWVRRVACLAVAVSIAAIAGSQETASVKFVDVAAKSGVTFRHRNAASSARYLIETMGSGAAWIDFDQDGRLDLYLVNSAGPSVLYRNNGDATFQDVTTKAGVAANGLFGMGAAAGDYDNDGRPDLYVTGYGRSILFRNTGGGVFADATASAGVANSGKWASSAAWFDYDRDGRLDLVIANYVDFHREKNVMCEYQGHPGYCHPNRYPGQKPTLYHNQGNGTFVDASASSGIGAKPGNGLGVVCFDANADGWQDVFIANDSRENFLFLNRRNGTFEETGLRAGVALSEDGKAEAGMGADAADYDGDGKLDIFVTHLDLEWNRLYRNRGGGVFEDATLAAKLGQGPNYLSGFGTRFIDFDNDGWRDLFVANGHVLDNVALYRANTSYAEKKTVYRNVAGRFVEMTERWGPDLLVPRVGRGAAFADYDNDGDIDVAINNNGQAAELLRNDGGNSRQWVEILLTGARSNRDGVGTVIKVTAGGRTQVEEAKGGMSYQSSHDPRIHFGLGAAATIDAVEVRWPSGVVDRLTGIRPGRVLSIREGSAAARSGAARD